MDKPNVEESYSVLHDLVYRVARWPEDFDPNLLFKAMRDIHTAVERISILERDLAEQALIIQNLNKRTR